MNWRDRAKQSIGKKGGGSALTKPTEPPYVSSVSSEPALSAKEIASDREEMKQHAEMERLLLELAKLEHWTPEELADLLDQRQRMAPVNIRAMFLAVKKAHAAALAPWPEPPAQRSRIRLCVLTVIPGGRSDSEPSRPSKTLAPEPEAA